MKDKTVRVTQILCERLCVRNFSKAMSCLLIAALMVFSQLATASTDDDLTALVSAFVTDFKALDIPEFDYSYEKNFHSIQDLTGINRQLNTFKQYARKLHRINRAALSTETRYLYDHFAYEVDFHLQRARLEKEFKTRYPDLIVPKDGLSKLPRHRKWYSLYVKRWSAKRISFAELWNLGTREIAKVTREIKVIQKDLGYASNDVAFYRHLNDDSFLIKDEKAVLDAYREIRHKADQTNGAVFEDTDIPQVDIRTIPNPNKDTPPGYYTQGVFYFNFFGGVHNRRVMDWLFVHEAVPGHHYQKSIERKLQLPCPEFMELFWYPGYSEGWAAYTEHLGKEVGLYQDVYSRLGKWEWDLVRSTRVVLDVGINLLSWSNARALRFWKRHVPNQDAIAIREIDRMRRWPGQVLSYKVGEIAILGLREYAVKHEESSFDIKKFHSLVLGRGSVPLDVLENVVRDRYEGKNI